MHEMKFNMSLFIVVLIITFISKFKLLHSTIYVLYIFFDHKVQSFLFQRFEELSCTGDILSAKQVGILQLYYSSPTVAVIIHGKETSSLMDWNVMFRTSLIIRN